MHHQDQSRSDEDADLTGTKISNHGHEKPRAKDAVDHLDGDEKEPDIERTFEETVAGEGGVRHQFVA
jgi:hypothetical protein